MLNRYALSRRYLVVLLIGLIFAAATALTQRVRAGSDRLAIKRPTPGQAVGKVPDLVSSATFQGYLPSSQQMKMLMHFQNRDEAGLKILTRELYDRTSSKYHHWLTPDEFGKRFGRSEGEITSTRDWLKGQGLNIDRVYPSRLTIAFSGTVDRVEQAFKIQMGSYWESANNRSFFSNLQPPTLPANMQEMVLSLVGLNNAYLKHPASAGALLQKSVQKQAKRTKTVKPQGVPGDPDFMSPTDLSIAYNYQALSNFGYQGQLQRVAIVIDSDVLDSDVALFRSSYGLPAADVVRQAVPGYSNPGLGQPIEQLEATLDIDAVSSVVPGAEIDLVLVPDLGTLQTEQAEVALVNSDFGFIPIVTQSFVACEVGVYDPGEAQVFDQAVAEGIAFFNSSGDNGAEACGVPGAGPPQIGPEITCSGCYPGVTSVGGTQFQATFNQTTGVLESVQSEDAWNQGNDATGGGVSTIVPIPWYQALAQGFTGGVPSGSTRTVPDVAAMAGSPYCIIFVNGDQALGGGTSFASPFWAGVMTLVNQFSGDNQGFANPQLYQYGITQYENGGTQTFNDITIGNSFLNGYDGCCTAGFGYDLTTGWGSPNVLILVHNYGTPPPANVVATATLANSITVTWAPEHVSGFNVVRSSTVNGKTRTIASGLTTNSFIDTPSTDPSFVPGQTYIYQV
ncbi:MAG TPA: protease pro-enzyme activation domain-containing protein, partial [Blastocatellia bacterium]